jgi:hypothetical protein
LADVGHDRGIVGDLRYTGDAMTIVRYFTEWFRIKMIRKEIEKIHRLVGVPKETDYAQNPLLHFPFTAPPKELIKFLAEQEAADNILPPKHHADR